MTDWKEWVAACKQFARVCDAWPVADDEDCGTNQWDIKPPISEDEAARLERSMRRPFPSDLRDFYLAGSGGIDCFWYWNPSSEYKGTIHAIFQEEGIGGGPIILDAQAQVERHNHKSGILEGWLRYGEPSPKERAVAENSFPLADVRNGDVLLLDVPEPGRGGGVYYFNHEDMLGSPLIEISESFEAFMLAWQHLFYVGPEGWNLAPFMERQDSGYGRLNMTLPNVTTWRRLVADLNASYRSD